MKICTKCQETKNLTDFHKSKKGKFGLNSVCKTCKNKQTKINQLKNQNRKTDNTLKNKYGITLEQKENMIAAQNGACAICEKELDNKKQTCVDHCHTTGKIRSILCQHCNMMLGHAKDNIKTLKKAIQYLTNHQQQ